MSQFDSDSEPQLYSLYSELSDFEENPATINQLLENNHLEMIVNKFIDSFSSNNNGGGELDKNTIYKRSNVGSFNATRLVSTPHKFPQSNSSSRLETESVNKTTTQANTNMNEDTYGPGVQIIKAIGTIYEAESGPEWVIPDSKDGEGSVILSTGSLIDFTGQNGTETFTANSEPNPSGTPQYLPPLPPPETNSRLEQFNDGDGKPHKVNGKWSDTHTTWAEKKPNENGNSNSELLENGASWDDGNSHSFGEKLRNGNKGSRNNGREKSQNEIITNGLGSGASRGGVSGKIHSERVTNRSNKKGNHERLTNGKGESWANENGNSEQLTNGNKYSAKSTNGNANEGSWGSNSGNIQGNGNVWINGKRASQRQTNSNGGGYNYPEKPSNGNGNGNNSPVKPNNGNGNGQNGGGNGNGNSQNGSGSRNGNESGNGNENGNGKENGNQNGNGNGNSDGNGNGNGNKNGNGKGPGYFYPKPMGNGNSNGNGSRERQTNGNGPNYPDRKPNSNGNTVPEKQIIANRNGLLERQTNGNGGGHPERQTNENGASYPERLTNRNGGSWSNDNTNGGSKVEKQISRPLNPISESTNSVPIQRISPLSTTVQQNHKSIRNLLFTNPNSVQIETKNSEGVGPGISDIFLQSNFIGSSSDIVSSISLPYNDETIADTQQPVIDKLETIPPFSNHQPSSYAATSENTPLVSYSLYSDNEFNSSLETILPPSSAIYSYDAE